MYALEENWVIRDSHTPSSKASYDIFYVYPTLVGKAEDSEMEWLDNPKIRQKVKGFAEAQTRGIFGEDARVFAPYVHQLTYESVMKIQKKGGLVPAEWPAFRRGMQDTVAAFRHYLAHDNHQRPFILLGHSQGAMDLYHLLRNCPEITPDNGFVAAYLAGLPHVTEAKIRSDFQGRIKPGKGASDLGVILAWNTQNQEATSTFCAGFGEYCINPLNWRTDAVPADRALHRLAYFYDYRDGSVKKSSQLFSAVISPDKGALLVDLPSNSEWDIQGFMGKGVFHANDVWFFAGNLRENAKSRVDKYLESKAE
ncbi:MAG: DUF3089 domain-containing protein [Victivallales bacterium]|nr:DUF3089 domain-containing protein [Victivallales bacterium]